MWWWQEHQTSSGETMKLAMQTTGRQGSPATGESLRARCSGCGPVLRRQLSPTTTPPPHDPLKQPKMPMRWDVFAEATTAPRSAPMTDGLIAGANKTDQPLLADKSLAAKEAKPVGASNCLARTKPTDDEFSPAIFKECCQPSVSQ